MSFGHIPSTDIFLFFPQKHMLWQSLEALIEALLMSTHNIIMFHGEVTPVKKVLCEYPSYLELCTVTFYGFVTDGSSSTIRQYLASTREV